MIRVLHIYRLFGRGGAQGRTMGIFNEIDRTKVQFDFILHTRDKCAYEDEARGLGANIYRLPRFIGLNYFAYRKAWREFLAQNNGYDAVHIHVTNFAFAFLPLLKDIPMRIAHAHNTSDSNIIKRVLVILTRSYIKKHASHFLAASKAAADFTFGKDAENVIVAPNPINVKAFAYNPQTRERVRKELGLGGSFVVGHAGRFYAQKNHVYLLKVTKKLQYDHPDTVLLLAGDGPLRHSVERKASEMGVNVMFLGVRKDVDDLMQAFDVFALPSLYEGLCNAVVEAQAAGLPCVVSDKLPKEVELIPSLITFLPIEQSAVTQWVEAIRKARGQRLDNTSDSICDLGFDVKTQAAYELQFYESGVRTCN